MPLSKEPELGVQIDSLCDMVSFELIKMVLDKTFAQPNIEKLGDEIVNTSIVTNIFGLTLEFNKQLIHKILEKTNDMMSFVEEMKRIERQGKL